LLVVERDESIPLRRSFETGVGPYVL